MRATPRRWSAALLLAASLDVRGARAASPDDADPFPVPAGYAGHVEFWTSVFGAWSVRQVALHDMLYPGLVYEVVDTGDGSAAAASELVERRRRDLEARLTRLQVMVEAGVPLTDDEKRLALLVATRAGAGAIPGAAARVRTQRGIRERFRDSLVRSGRFVEAFRAVFRAAGLPEDLAYLPHVESSFEIGARSSAGAVGMWQFTRATGRRFLRITASVDERLDPVAAARGAARYLGQAHARLGSWPLAVTSYNHGVEGMARARARFGTDFDRIVREYDGRVFGFASKNFYAEFLAARAIARDPGAHFPEGVDPEPPLILDELILPAAVAPDALARKYGVSVAALERVNPAWSPRVRQRGARLPAGMSVWLPGGTLKAPESAAAMAPARGAP